MSASPAGRVVVKVEDPESRRGERHVLDTRSHRIGEMGIRLGHFAQVVQAYGSVDSWWQP